MRKRAELIGEIDEEMRIVFACPGAEGRKGRGDQGEAGGDR